MKKVISAAAILGVITVVAPASASIWDTISNTVSSAVNRAKDVGKHASKAASESVSKAAKGDFDAVANSVIDASGYPGPFRDAVLHELNKVTPNQFKGITERATAMAVNIDDHARSIRTETYRNLYTAYKADLDEAYRRIKEKDLDFSEYYRYIAVYDIAQQDWKKDPAGSARRVGVNRYKAYAYYSKHTLKGAAINAARDEFGLTNAAIEKGITEFADDLKDLKLGVTGVAILTEFNRASRKNYIGTDEELEQGGFITSENGRYSVVFQGDCNLVFIGPNKVEGLLDHHRHGSFAEYARNHNRCRCLQQGDGNLVVYGFQGNKPVGATLGKAKSRGKYFTIVQDDGNVVTYPGTDPAHVRARRSGIRARANRPHATSIGDDRSGAWGDGTLRAPESFRRWAESRLLAAFSNIF